MELYLHSPYMAVWLAQVLHHFLLHFTRYNFLPTFSLQLALHYTPEGRGFDSRWCHWNWHNPSGRTMALRWTQPLTEMSTRNISWWAKAVGAWGWQHYHFHMLIVLKSGSLNLPEPSEPVQICNGIALSFRAIKPSHLVVRLRMGGAICTHSGCVRYLPYFFTNITFFKNIVCIGHRTELLIYMTNFTCTKIYTYETLVNFLHVSARHRCHHQGVFSVANVAPSKWSVAV